MRRFALTRFLATIVIGLIPISPAVLAQEKTRSANELDPEIRSAVDRATVYLLNHQDPNWGYFSRKKHFLKADQSNFRPPSESTAVTALSIMSLLATGHLPGEDSREGRALDQAIRFLTNDRVIEDGYFGQHDGSRMYGHGIVTLCLAELVGMIPDEATDKVVRLRLTRAVQIIVDAQKVRKDDLHRGGWRYQPTSNDSDLSATVWQVMALRAAKGAGVEVSDDAIGAAIRYVKACSSVPENADDSWQATPVGFAYQSWSKGSQPPTTAAGVLSLQVCGAYECAEVRAGALKLLEDPPKWDKQWFFYGLYYYSQCMYVLDGDYEEASDVVIRRELLENQNSDGSWLAHSNERNFGEIYATSFALLALSVHHHYLPIYQR